MAGLIVLVSALALTTGAAAAQFTGPAACDWRARPGQMKRRLLALRHIRSPGRIGKLAAAASMATLFTGATLAAYAAQPSAPQQLPSEVVGVTGSGDQISLQIKPAGAAAERTLRIGDEYKDGWTLKALTPAVATLAKDGQSQAVGLNPAGALPPAAETGPKTAVTFLNDQADSSTPPSTDSAGLLATARSSGYWNGQPKPGLTQAETERYVAYGLRLSQARQPLVDAFRNKQTGVLPGINLYDNISQLGSDGVDYMDLLQKDAQATYDSRLASYNAFVAQYGDLTVYVPNYTTPGSTSFTSDALARASAAIKAFLDARGITSTVGWSYASKDIDAGGGITARLSKPASVDQVQTGVMLSLGRQ